MLLLALIYFIIALLFTNRYTVKRANYSYDGNARTLKAACAEVAIHVTRWEDVTL